jgi:peptidoglycan/xylan/chitin deacetylase (PgdA/CDA1 family)
VIRHRAAGFFLEAIGALGGLRAVRAVTGQHPRVLAYHRLAAETGPRTLGVAEFRRQMHILRRKFHVISLDELCDALRERRPFARNAIVLTFDDGYADFYELAFPVLKELNLPATLYVPTEFMAGSFWLWPDRIRWAVNHSRASTLEFRAPHESAGRVLHIGDSTQREAAWNVLADIALSLPAQDRDTFIATIEKALQVDIPDQPSETYQALSWQQLAQMHAEGLCIGSHSRTHARLSLESRERQWSEISESKSELESRLRCRIRHFCYPHGRQVDYTPETRSLVEAAGYESAAVAFADERPVADILALRRYTVHSDLRDFERAIYGWKYLRSLVGASGHAPGN